MNERDETRLAQDKRGDGIGPPLWQLSLLDDCGATFCRGKLVDSKKREVLLHLSREKKLEFQERIYRQVRRRGTSRGYQVFLAGALAIGGCG